MNIGLVITAAGRSERFGSNKLFELIHHKTALTLCLASFADQKKIKERVLVVAKESDDELIQKMATGYKIVKGGNTRAQSVKNGVYALSGCDAVMIHDAARPFVSRIVLDHLTEALAKGSKAVIPTLPVTDTIKQAIHHKVIKTVDRSSLVSVQTPQGFDLETLKRCYEQTTKETLEKITDEAMLLESYQVPIQTITGDPRTLKITHPIDIKILKALLNQD